MVSFLYPPFPSMLENRRSHLEFIRINWPVAAAIAWREYCTQGRGCIVIDVKQAKDPPPGETSHLLAETPGAYVSQEMVKTTGDLDVLRMLAEYDPLIEVVFVFLRLDDGVSAYRLAMPGMAPPDQYQCLQHELLETI